MIGMRTVIGKLLLCLLVLAPVSVPRAEAQAYPSKPVRIIVAAGQGGAADTLARLVSQHLGQLWGKPVVVENIPAAGGVVGTQAMVKAAPDGYTLGVIGTQHMINRAFNPNLPYDSVKDLRGVVTVINSTIVVVSSATLPVNSVDELVKLAKSKPTALDYGSSGTGGLLHLVLELFSQQAGIRMTHVPYPTSPKMITDLLAGRIGVGALTGVSALPFIKAGKLKALVVGDAQRSRYFPDVPTGAEAGLPGFVVRSWNGIAAPAQTPDAVVSRLFADISTITRKAEFQSQITAGGFELDVLDGEQTWKRVTDESDMWTKLVKEVGIRP